MTKLFIELWLPRKPILLVWPEQLEGWKAPVAIEPDCPRTGPVVLKGIHASEHARIALDKIARTISGAILCSTANASPNVIYELSHGLLGKTTDDDLGMPELFVEPE